MKQFAITTGQIATIHNGRRLVKHYQAGEPLVGYIPDEKPSQAFIEELKGKWQTRHKFKGYKGN